LLSQDGLKAITATLSVPGAFVGWTSSKGVRGEPGRISSLAMPTKKRQRLRNALLGALSQLEMEEAIRSLL
jgi:hypothetical protein